MRTVSTTDSTDAADTRQRLLDAAAELLLQHGFDAVSMDSVRQKAQVSNGSLYHHFPSKAQLAAALYERTLRDFHAALGTALAGEVDTESGIRKLLRAYLAWVAKHPEGAQLLHRLRRHEEVSRLDADWAAANGQAYAALNAWAEQRMAAGQLRRLPFAVWMALIFAPALALTPQWQKPPPPAIRRALEDAAWHAVAPTEET